MNRWTMGKMMAAVVIGAAVAGCANTKAWGVPFRLQSRKAIRR